MKQLIDEQLKDFMKRFIEPKSAEFLLSPLADEYDEMFGWHKQSLKQFIDELIARENEKYDNPDNKLIYKDAELRQTWNESKFDTLAHLKELKEELN